MEPILFETCTQAINTATIKPSQVPPLQPLLQFPLSDSWPVFPTVNMATAFRQWLCLFSQRAEVRLCCHRYCAFSFFPSVLKLTVSYIVKKLSNCSVSPARPCWRGQPGSLVCDLYSPRGRESPGSSQWLGGNLTATLLYSSLRLHSAWGGRLRHAHYLH